MINKQLFFVWIGKKIPSYVNYTINIFKDVNPTFKVDLIVEHDIDHTNNADLKRCRDIVYNNDINDELHGKHMKSVWFNTKLKDKTIQKICDIYRFELLYKYGGIYLDCDTFPIKPFDSKLLEYNNFCCKSCYEPKNYIFNDIYFIGCDQKYKFDFKDNGDVVANNIINTEYCINNKKTNYIKHSDLCYKCELKYGQTYSKSKDCYIDHYGCRLWDK